MCGPGVGIVIAILEPLVGLALRNVGFSGVPLNFRDNHCVCSSALDERLSEVEQITIPTNTKRFWDSARTNVIDDMLEFSDAGSVIGTNVGRVRAQERMDGTDNL